jgi:RNA recognition motif-containing protein
MSQKLYVGNLPWRTTEEDFRELFKDFGPIHSVLLVTDQETNMSRGFGFVELDELRAEAAISALEQTTFLGRTLRVSKAVSKAPEKKPSGGFGYKSPGGRDCGGGRGCGDMAFPDRAFCPAGMLCFMGERFFFKDRGFGFGIDKIGDYHRYKFKNDEPHYCGRSREK